MKASLLTAFAVCASLSSIVYAQNPSVGAYFSAKLTHKHKCDGDCTQTRTTNVVAGHQFYLTPARAASINADSMVRFHVNNDLFSEFRIGDDPNYEEGDKEASVVTLNSELGMPIEIVNRVSWKDGIFKLFILGYGSYSENLMASLGQKEHNRAFHVAMETEIASPGEDIIEARITYAASLKYGTFGQNLADGTTRLQLIQRVATAHRIPLVPKDN